MLCALLGAHNAVQTLFMAVRLVMRLVIRMLTTLIDYSCAWQSWSVLKRLSD